MTKAQLHQANYIYIHTIEMLMRQNAEYEAMYANCTIMPKEYYKEMIEDFHAMKNKVDTLEQMVANVGVRCIAGECRGTR